MASTPTTRLRFEKQAQGDNLLTWGDVANAIFDRVDEAIAGEAAISTTGGDTTLSATNYDADQARMSRLYVSGTLTSNAVLIVPVVDKEYTVVNATTGTYTLTIKTASVAGIAVPQGAAQRLFIRGADGSAWSAGAPAPSGSAILKGNGSGGFSSAVAGTDYQAPNEQLDDIAAITPVRGDVLYFNGTAWVALAAGTVGQSLATGGAGADPSWADPPATGAVGSNLYLHSKYR